MSTIIRDTLFYDTEYDNRLYFSISESVITKIENGKTEEVFVPHLSFHNNHSGIIFDYSIDEIDVLESFFKRCKYLISLNRTDFINEIYKNKKSNKSDDIYYPLLLSYYSLFIDGDCVVRLKHEKLSILDVEMDRPQETIDNILKLIENMKKLK